VNDPVEPYASGLLRVSDGADLWWETSGNPDGQPALYLHGGPGGRLGAGYRRRFAADRWRIVGLDQRGSGRSRPRASDDLGSLTTNTTQRLVADLEELRVHLGIDRWLLHGASWGTGLAVAYAAAHPDRVSGVVLTAVALTTAPYVTWITETVGMLFPVEWADFARAAQRQPGERVVDAYARRLADPDTATAERRRAATDWCRWEGVHISLGPGIDGTPMYDGDPDQQLLTSTLVTHYWSHDGFLDHDQLLARIPALAGIPCVMVHGRYDVSGPAGFAYELQQAWPGSELILVDEGHGGAQMMELTARAIDRLGEQS
jgi:proline iminopeptidase